MKKSLCSVVPIICLLLWGCGTQNKQDISDYQIMIPEPIVVTTDPSGDTVIGELEMHDVSLTISGEAFEQAQSISLHTPTVIPSNIDDQKLVGSPIEILAGETPVRLLDKTTITFKFNTELLPEGTDHGALRVAYYNGTQWDYIKPIAVDMNAGTMTFETYHFSLLAPKIADEKKITEQFINSQSLDNVIRDGFNNESDFVTDQIIAMTLSKMGITNEETQKKIFDKVANAQAYKEIVDLYNSGDTETAHQKVALLAGEKIAENVPDSLLKQALGNVVGAADDIAKVSEAAGYMAEGQYKQAAKIIGENIADKFLITTAGKIAVEVVEGQIQSWKNAEVDAAYQAYKNGADGYFWGYNVDKNDFNAIWDQMRGVRRQLEIEAIKKENAIRTDGGMPELSDREEALVRARVKTAFQKQFEERSKKEDIIKKEQEKLKLIFDAFENAELMSNTFGPQGLDKDYTYEQKLELLHHFAQKMMRDTNRTEVSERDGLVMETKISTADLVIGAKKYFSEPDGKQQYEDYLKERFKIGLYPTIDEMAGNWTGTITITEVIVSEEFKTQGAGSDEGCDLAALEEMIGTANPITLAVKPNNKTGGMVSIVTDEEAKPMPFTYYDGVFEAPIYQDQATGKIHMDASKTEGVFAMNGSMYVSYGNDDIKIKGVISVTK